MKRILSIILVLNLLLVNAAAFGTTSERIDYEDGSYVIITTTSQRAARSSSTHTKAAAFYDSSNKKCFIYTLYATFYYDGRTSSATACSGAADFYQPGWSLDSHSEYPVGNKAVGTAYFRGPNDVIRNVSLNMVCDVNGNVT